MSSGIGALAIDALSELVSRIVVDDGVDHFSHGDLLLDSVEEVEVINSALRTALYVKLTPPLVAGANIQYTKETKAKKGSEVMIIPKNPQKSPSAEIAHMNDLLDEAPTETFPASDPIAINVELELPGHGIAITPRASHSALRHIAPWTR